MIQSTMYDRNFRITDINILKSEIIRRKIAREEELVGCSEHDLESIQQQYGKLPLVYKQIISLLGYGAGSWLSIDEYDFDVHRAIYLNKWMKEDDSLVDETGELIINELKNVFFISGKYAELGGELEFIKLNIDLLDSCVYTIDMAYYGDIDEWIDTIEITYESIWNWIECLVDKAENRMLAAESKNNISFWQKLFSN
jgi:hypothetical protein